jgi:hypothetical protein
LKVAGCESGQAGSSKGRIFNSATVDLNSNQPQLNQHDWRTSRGVIRPIYGSMKTEFYFPFSAGELMMKAAFLVGYGADLLEPIQS